MISWHPTAKLGQRPPRDGFLAVPVCDMMRIAKCVSHYIWSPIAFRHGVRREDHFVESFWCALDFEDPAITLDDAVNSFCDMRHVIATTKSHGIAKGKLPAIDRFRVILEWSEPIADLRTFRWNMRRMVDRHGADKACIDGARLYFPCRDIVSVNGDADAFTEPVSYDIPADFESIREGLGADQVLRSKQTGKLPGFCDYWLRHVIPVGKRNTYCYAIAKELSQIGIGLGEIRARIFASPTYAAAQVTPALKREIDEATRNGARDGAKCTKR